jgi:putative radical SAM enzyme (TIGR03279 family)
MRKPLYVKDEDYRLSFLNGNFVTLANLSNAALERIIKQRLSPLYISVHATNPVLREHLLGKPGIPPVMEQLETLAVARVAMHTQIVLCPGLNDGEELQRTVADLAVLYPAVQSVAIVPVGLTDHREKLPQLTPVDSSYARKIVSLLQPQAEKLRRKYGRPFLFLADEFFLKAGVTFPAIKMYGDFPQIENGVGMVPLFMKEAARLLREARPLRTFRATVVTGVSSFEVVRSFLVQLKEKTGVDIVPLAVENKLFGASITVSGLVVGNDILRAVADVDIGSCLLIPDVMLKEGEDLFLDDVSLKGLEKCLGCPVLVFDSTPRGCYKTMRIFEKKLKQER